MQYWDSVYPYLNNQVVAEYLERHSLCTFFGHDAKRSGSATQSANKLCIPVRFTGIPPIMKRYLQTHYDDLVCLCKRHRYRNALTFLKVSHMYNL